MKGTTKKATVAQVAIGNITIEGLMLPNGDYAVAVPQIFDLFGKGAGFGTTRNQASRDLKRLMGKGFNTTKISTELGKAKVLIVDLKQFELIVAKLDRAGNKLAQDFRDSLVGLSLQQLFCDAFGQKFESQDRQAWLKARAEGKQTRRLFTDAIADYIFRHEKELSDGRKNWLYTNATNQVNLQVFGVSAKKLREMGIDGRDNYTSNQLLRVYQLEDVAIALIDEFDVEPTEAVKQAADRVLLACIGRRSKPCQV